MVSLIAAVSKNGVIGKGGRLPWHLPADLKRFKALTMGHPVIMGRKTFESIGRPLPGRTNIVVSRQTDWKVCGAAVVPSIEEALASCEKARDIFVIGGADLFRQILPFADRIYLTRIEKDFEGDTKLFEMDPKIWKETSREEHLADPLPHRFLTYERK